MTIRLQSVNKILILRHVLAWSIFIIYEICSVYFATGIIGHAIPYFLFYLLNISLFYFNAYKVLPSAFTHKLRPYLFTFLFIAIEMFVYLTIKFLVDFELHKIPSLKREDLIYTRYIIVNLWRGLFFVGISTLYWSVLRIVNYQKQEIEAENRYFYSLAEKSRLEQTLAETQNAYLQQQINPHFLFNALNFIYNSFYKCSSSAATCVSKLADIMRYSFDEVDPDGKAKLSLEIEQITNLIEINRLRYKFPLYIQFEINGNIQDQRILPLVLLSFTENMFKHGNLKEQGYPAQLYIELKDPNQLTFISSNLKKSWYPSKEDQHIGLSNAVKRLEYTYMEDYRLSIKDEEDTFGIELHINL